MAWVEKLPSGRYRGMYRLPNGEKRSVGTFPHKKVAKDAAVEAEGKTKRAGWRDPRAGQITWRDWHAIWWRSRAIEPQTKSSESSMVSVHIMPRWGDVALADIKRSDVQTWVMEMIAANVGTDEDPAHRSPATVRRVLTPFASSLAAAVDAEVLVANPALRIKVPPAPPVPHVFLTRAQYAQLAAQTSGQDRAVLDMLVGTGMRWGELAALHVHSLDLARGLVTIADVTDGSEVKPYPKGRRQRRVPLLQWMVDELEVPSPTGCGLKHRGRRGCQSGLVFPTAGGGVRDDRNFYRRTLQPALQRAGLEDLGATIHDLRHTYASWLVQDGVPLTRVAELLGHASTRTTEIYAHFAPAQASDIEAALRDPHGANVGLTDVQPGVTALHSVPSYSSAG